MGFIKSDIGVVVVPFFFFSSSLSPVLLFREHGDYRYRAFNHELITFFFVDFIDEIEIEDSCDVFCRVERGWWSLLPWAEGSVLSFSFIRIPFFLAWRVLHGLDWD